MGDDDAAPDPVVESIRRLEDRLAAVEQELTRLRGSNPPAVAPAPPVQRAIPVSRPPPLPVAAPPPSAVLPNIASTMSMKPRFTPRSIPPKRNAPNFEALIGKNLASWIGAVVLVLGVFFFLKYAWDQGWIRPTPTMRIVAAISLGVLVSAIGERLHLRGKMTQLAGALHGAGLAIVMSSFFAAYAGFSPEQRVLEIPGAYAGVVVTAAIGIVVALHVGAMTPAIIALIGAYLAPSILSTGEDKSLQLLSYLLVLAMVGWGLGVFRPRWLAVRWLTWIATVVWYGVWWEAASKDRNHDALALLVASIFYAGFHAEMFFSSQRNSTRETERWPALERTLAAMSLLNTAALFAALYAILEPQPPMLLGCITIGLAFVQGGLAVVSRSTEFRLCAMIQSAALATIAAPLILDNFSVTIAWLAMAAAVLVLGKLVRIPKLHSWGLVLLLLSIGRLFIFDLYDPSLRTPLASFGGGTVTQWMLLTWSTAIFAHVVGWLSMSPAVSPAHDLSEDDEAVPAPAADIPVLQYASRPMRAPRPVLQNPSAPVIAGIGTALFLAACLTQWNGSEFTLLACLWLAAIVVAARVLSSPAYVAHALILALLLSLKWLTFDGLFPLIDQWNKVSATVSPPVLNLVALDAVLIIACTVALNFQIRAKAAARDSRIPFSDLFEPAGWTAWALCLLFALINIESLRAIDYLASRGQDFIADHTIIKQVTLSILWAITGFALVVFGFRKKIPQLRYAALTLLTITLLKIFLVDMAEVKAIWRILSFLAVGALLLAVSYLYHRQSASDPAAGPSDAPAAEL